MTAINEGIVIGAFGGAAAGIMISVLGFVRSKYIEWRDKKVLFIWLTENTCDEDGNRFRSTRAIASYNNLTEDRVRFICSIHKKIAFSIGKKEDMWGLVERRL